MAHTLYIVSGEGTTGTVERYTGKPGLRALKVRLTRERCGGNRWAKLLLEYNSDPTTRDDIEPTDAARLLWS